MNNSSAIPVIKERFDPGLISALYQNFKDPIQAILELVDNAIDDLAEGKTMYITADVGRDSISVVNKGGTGMGAAELDAFFAWGQSSKRGRLGRYGQGGKAALGYLGRSWKISATKTGEEEEYVIEEPDWDDRTGGLKEYTPKVLKSNFVEEGVVQIDVRRLKRKINKKELKRSLAKVYRPLIRLGRVEVFSNGKVSTDEYPLEMPEEHFELELNGEKKLTGWLGILERGSRIRGGIRCYAFGRLIVEKEFFGQKDPSFKESLDRLIGELYIEDEELPLLINKSDFDRGSPIWEEINKKMFDKMEPYIEILLGEKDADVPSEREQKSAKYAGEIWAQFLRYLRHEQREGAMPGLPIDYGQKAPESKEGQITNDSKTQEDDAMKKYQPATPPPINPVGKRRRTGSFPQPKLHPLPEPVRYQLAEENGIKVIKINTRFPLYKLRKNQLPLYIWETLAFEYAKEEDSDTQTTEEYINEVNQLLHDLGAFVRKKNIKITN